MFAKMADKRILLVHKSTNILVYIVCTLSY
jgi:hypothetical protein